MTPDTDAKLQELKKLIAAKVSSPTTNKLGQPNKKVLVFTAFADTAAYLVRFAGIAWAQKELGIHIALVTGGGDNQTTFKAKTDLQPDSHQLFPALQESRQNSVLDAAGRRDRFAHRAPIAYLRASAIFRTATS